jgi:signal transduction histidine kinase
MNRALWLRFLGISLVFALVLSAVFLLIRRELAGNASNDVQNSVYLFLARIVEEKPYAESIKRVDGYRAESPAMRFDLWVVSGSGHILASSTNDAPPASFDRLAKPQHVHDVVSKGRFFAGAAALAIVRLDAADPTYLLVRNARSPGQHVFLELAALFIATLVGAMFIGLLLVTLYLRGRSRQVRQVIGRIEAGDLAARFEVDRLDAVGGLMLHFNRMADEIQRLVARLQSIERSRRDLLQELGHDLRTPLTSLQTGIETLAAHGQAMSGEERREFFTMISGELVYFKKLIDDLFFIAEIDEPRYHQHAEHIDLRLVLDAEVRLAQGNHRTPQIELEADAAQQGLLTTGDRHLIARLFRNALDNALRHARSRIRVGLAAQDKFIAIAIEDDGPGMSADAIAGFGLRRSQRLLANSSDFAASLGLGSVIIKTIVELHGGHFKLESPPADGTTLTIYLPRIAASP